MRQERATVASRKTTGLKSVLHVPAAVCRKVNALSNNRLYFLGLSLMFLAIGLQVLVGISFPAALFLLLPGFVVCYAAIARGFANNG